MRAIRELPLAAPLVLAGLAVFFGGGVGNGSLMWLGGGALAVLLYLLATRGLPGGVASLASLAALVGWLALSIAWSSLPDRSWDYADRGLVYLLFAALGLWLASRTRQLALGLCVLLGAVVVWSLAGKVLPFLYPDYGRLARLRGPVGLWNQLALLADIALPLALWRRGRGGTLLAYGWIVALVLTYSRGGLLTGILVLAAWFVFTDERLESAMTLFAAAAPAAVVLAVSFTLPGVTSDGVSSHERWRDGLIFGALLLAGAAAALALERVPPPRVTPALKRSLLAAGVAGVVGVVAVVALKGGGTGELGNGGGRIASTSSNFRFAWWNQALHGWKQHELLGTGAGSFNLTNLRYRASYLDFTIEPHNLPLQFLTETGVVGLVLFLFAAASLLRGSLRRRGHELALALVLPAYLVHSLVDIDWDVVAVSAPVFLVAGALVGRPALRRVPLFSTVVAAGIALLAFCALLLPWLGERWSAEAAVSLSPKNAMTLARRARSVDPLLVEPLLTLGFAADLANRPFLARAYYAEAVRSQPKNPETLLEAGLFELENGCPRHAYAYLEPFTELDPKERPDPGPIAYRRALKLVDSGTPTC
ncbi:MAG TPA: O-antigen ligase family protein [Gaiellaceae bacterium]|nr:O-antigen ligase family protein [Gaiellaceae bacterium]